MKRKKSYKLIGHFNVENLPFRKGLDVHYLIVSRFI